LIIGNVRNEAAYLVLFPSPNSRREKEKMTLKTILLSAASALVLSAGAASAAPATAESAVNVRSGPGTQYEVIGTIPGGATVDVAGCTGSWCQVSFNGETGYANQNYLSVAEGGPAVVAPGYAYDDTPYYDNYDDDGYAYGPGVGFYASPGHRFHRGGHAWNGGQWNGGHAWNGGRPGGNNAGAVRQGFAGPPASWQRPGTGIGAAAPRGGMTGAPTGMRTGGGAIGGGAIGGGGAPAGGGAQGGFAGSIVRH
jgi:hypothetical protein